MQRYWAKTERPAETRLNARCGGLLQRLSTGVFTEFVGGFGKVWIAISTTANHAHGTLPTKHGQHRGGWTRFWFGPASVSIQQLACHYSCSVSSWVLLRLLRTVKRNKDSQDDKASLCDRCGNAIPVSPNL